MGQVRQVGHGISTALPTVHSSLKETESALTWPNSTNKKGFVRTLHESGNGTETNTPSSPRSGKLQNC